jgi:hypothetical protein
VSPRREKERRDLAADWRKTAAQALRLMLEEPRDPKLPALLDLLDEVDQLIGD